MNPVPAIPDISLKVQSVVEVSESEDEGEHLRSGSFGCQFLYNRLGLSRFRERW